MKHESLLFIKLVAALSVVFALFSCSTTTLPTNKPNTVNINNVTPSLADRNYTQLQQAIPIYQEAVMHPWAVIPSHPKLKPGVKSVTVLALRGRLKATGELKPEDDYGLTLYDKEVTAAVKRFQITHGLEPTGAVGPATLAELNVPPAERLRQIQVNMERWSKLSHELGNRYIMVNVPDYRLDVVENGVTVLSMKAIVGTPKRPTPEIASTITRVVLNPYWNVPKTIAEQDIVPKVISDPNYLEKMNIEILDQQTDDPMILNPNEVDWEFTQENGFPYHFRQRPGSNNALGLVKFEFENSYAIYLHDTPAKNLFAQSKRDFSSGCIRLEKPFELANYLMKSDPDWDERMQDMLEKGKTRYVKANLPTNIFITYLTAWVDDQGHIQFRDDVYSEDGLSVEE